MALQKEKARYKPYFYLRIRPNNALPIVNGFVLVRSEIAVTGEHGRHKLAPIVESLFKLIFIFYKTVFIQRQLATVEFSFDRVVAAPPPSLNSISITTISPHATMDF